MLLLFLPPFFVLLSPTVGMWPLLSWVRSYAQLDFIFYCFGFSSDKQLNARFSLLQQQSFDAGKFLWISFFQCFFCSTWLQLTSLQHSSSCVSPTCCSLYLPNILNEESLLCILAINAFSNRSSVSLSLSSTLRACFVFTSSICRASIPQPAVVTIWRLKHALILLKWFILS